jgi:hypothetical protein
MTLISNNNIDTYRHPTESPTILYPADNIIQLRLAHIQRTMENTSEAVTCAHSVPATRIRESRDIKTPRKRRSLPCCVVKLIFWRTVQGTMGRARAIYQETELNLYHISVCKDTCDALEMHFIHSRLTAYLITHRRPTNHQSSISLLRPHIRHASELIRGFLASCSSRRRQPRERPLSCSGFEKPPIF